MKHPVCLTTASIPGLLADVHPTGHRVVREQSNHLVRKTSISYPSPTALLGSLPRVEPVEMGAVPLQTIRVVPAALYRRAAGAYPPKHVQLLISAAHLGVVVEPRLSVCAKTVRIAHPRLSGWELGVWGDVVLEELLELLPWVLVRVALVGVRVQERRHTSHLSLAAQALVLSDSLLNKLDEVEPLNRGKDRLEEPGPLLPVGHKDEHRLGDKVDVLLVDL